MKDRVPDHRWRETIGRALDLVSPWQRILGEVRFVAGVDPGFIGLHSFKESDSDFPYSATPHCCYPWHLDSTSAIDRVPTIVLPKPTTVGVVVHELGHALHFRLGFEPAPAAVTDYAKTDRYEAFAEYFVAHLFHYGDQDVYGADDTRLLLDSLR